MGINRRTFGASIAAGLVGRLRALPPRPRLFVLVIIEQFRPDYIEAAATQFSTGGFKRLLDKGAYFPDCRHLASTFPASTIATLATGAWPAQHGIVADRWYDRTIRTLVPASDEELLATTLPAQIASDPRATVTVISMDDYAAGLFAGTPNARVFWMDDAGQFATLGDAPDWLAAFNNQKSAENARNAAWRALGAKPEQPALRTLTYSEEHPKEFMTLYKSSYLGQAAQFDFLGELITRDRLGQGNSFDFVCLIAGAGGLLGYETGARSPLMRQMTLQLDRRVESLLAQLTKVPGENAFGLAVVGGHGAPPEPPEDLRDRMAVKGEAVAQSVERALEPNALGRVERYLYPFLYLDTSGFRDPEPVRLAAARAALRNSAVADYYTAGGACSTRAEWETRFRNSFHARRSGDVMLSYYPEYVEDYGQRRGVSYGSIYNYDACVPLFLYGPQFRGGVFDTPIESVDLVPTLARALGVPTPSSSVGRVLGEALLE